MRIVLAIAAIAAIAACAHASPPAPSGPRFGPFTHPDVPANTTVEAPDPIHTPNPPAAELAATKTAMFTKGNYVGRVYFCVHPSGITRHALKRRMIKLKIDRPRGPGSGSLPGTDT